MNILSIGTKEISYIENSLTRIKTSSINFKTILVEETFDAFLSKAFFDRNFFDSVKKADLVVVDSMMLKDLIAKQDYFIFFKKMQKFFYFMYSINRNTSYFLSLYFFDVKFIIKNHPKSKFLNKIFEILMPEDFYKASNPSDPEISINLKHSFFNIKTSRESSETKTPYKNTALDKLNTEESEGKFSRIQKILEKNKKNVIIKNKQT
jgi:hypothetical protein